MNTKILAIAISLIAGTAFVSPVQAAPSIATLQAVQVRPDTAQLAQQAWERSSTIPTLAAVQVRPSADQLGEQNVVVLAAAVAAPITTLAAVEVRPSLEQKVALAAELQAERYTVALATAASAFANNVIVNLPVVQVRPSQSELQALAMETAMVLVRP